MKKLLKFLDGKKTIILSVIVLVVPYLELKMIIDSPTRDLLLQVSAVLLGSAQGATLVMNRK